MENVPRGLQELRAHVSVLIKENADNKAKIVLLETRLSDSEDRVKELEDKTSETQSENVARIAKTDRKFQTLKNKVVRIEQQQQQQVEHTNGKLKSLDKLRLLLNHAIIDKATAVDDIECQIELLSYRLDSACQSVEERLNSKLDSVSKSIEEQLNLRLDSVSKSIEERLNLRLDSVSKSLEEQLNFRLDSVSKSVEERLNFRLDSLSKSVEERLNLRLDSLSKSVEERLNLSLDSVNKSVEERLNLRLDSVSKSVEEWSSFQLNSVSKAVEERLNFRLDSVGQVAEDLKLKVRSSSSQLDELRIECTSLHKEFADLRLFRSKKGETQVQSVPADTVESYQDSRLKRDFDLLLKILCQRLMDGYQDHKLPLDSTDFIRLSGLEAIAGTQNGPGFKAVLAYQKGNSLWAEEIRQKERKELHDQGITLPIHAYKEFSELCGQATTTPSATKFFYVNWEVGGSNILAVDKFHVRRLSSMTKKEIQSWPLTDIHKCDSSDGWITLKFKDSRVERFRTWEHINTEVQQILLKPANELDEKGKERKDRQGQMQASSTIMTKYFKKK